MAGLCDSFENFRCGSQRKRSILIKGRSLKFYVLIIALSFTLISAEKWQNFTNANFIYDLTGDSLFLYGATGGGFLIFSITGDSFIKLLNYSDGLPSNLALAIEQDPAKNIWIGTGQGLVIYEPFTEEIKVYPQILIPRKITGIDISGKFVLLGTDEGVYLIDTKGTYLDFSDDTIYRYSTATHPQLLSDKIMSVLIKDGYWIGTHRGVNFLARDGQTWQTYPRPLGDSVKAITTGPADSIYCLTEKGIARFNGVGFDTFYRFPTAHKVFDLLYDRNSYYIALDSGLWRYRPLADSLDSLLPGEVRSIFLNRTAPKPKKFWVSRGGHPNFGNGLANGNDTIWKHYLLPTLSGQTVTATITDRNRSIYACHWGTNRIDYLPYGKRRWEVIWDPFWSPYLTQIDRHGILWFGHFGVNVGVTSYDPNARTWKVYQWGSISYRNVICALGIDHNNIKWVWNQLGTIIGFEQFEDQIEIIIPGVTGPPGPGYEFAFDSKNRVYLGMTGGLLRLDYNNTLFNRADDRHQIYTEADGLPALQVFTVAVDLYDRVWVGTTNGAGVLEGDRFRVINEDNSELLSNNIRKIRTDSWGRVWFLTDRGLSIYDLRTNRWESYTPTNSGLIATQYNWLHIDEEQNIALIATEDGVVTFDYTIPSIPSLNSIKIYPNPCITELDKGIVIDSLPDGADVKIYSLNGLLLTELKIDRARKNTFWETRDVPSGIYLILIKTPFGNRVEKVSVIR